MKYKPLSLLFIWQFQVTASTTIFFLTATQSWYLLLHLLLIKLIRKRYLIVHRINSRPILLFFWRGSIHSSQTIRFTKATTNSTALLPTRLSGTCRYAITEVSFPSHPSSPSSSVSHHLFQLKEIYSRAFHKAELDTMIRSSMCSSSSYMFGGADWRAAAHFLLHGSSAAIWCWCERRYGLTAEGWKGEEGCIFFVIKDCAGVSLPASIFQKNNKINLLLLHWKEKEFTQLMSA